MDYGNEFKKFATQEHGVNSMYYDQLISSMTPYIIEERQMNVAQMDVFSRLMMDRIIFLGTAINDSIANIIQAQLLFLESVDKSKDIQIYINSPAEAYMLVLEFTIPCSSFSPMWLQFVPELLLRWQPYCFVLVKKENDLDSHTRES